MKNIYKDITEIVKDNKLITRYIFKKEDKYGRDFAKLIKAYLANIGINSIYFVGDKHITILSDIEYDALENHIEQLNKFCNEKMLTYDYLLKAINSNYQQLKLIVENYNKGFIDAERCIENLTDHIEFNLQSIYEEIVLNKRKK